MLDTILIYIMQIISVITPVDNIVTSPFAYNEIHSNGIIQIGIRLFHSQLFMYYQNGNVSGLGNIGNLFFNYVNGVLGTYII